MKSEQGIASESPVTRNLMAANSRRPDECDRYLAKDAPMLRSYFAAAFLIASIANVQSLMGQHCPPIVESYLESVLVKHIDEGISLAIDYKKSGGKRKKPTKPMSWLTRVSTPINCWQCHRKMQSRLKSFLSFTRN